MKCWWTIPIPAPIASRADENSTRLAVQQKLPGVGPVQAVEDVHQRRLPGAVLAEQRMDLTAAHVEIDVVVATVPGNYFCTVHLENEIVGHRGAS